MLVELVMNAVPAGAETAADLFAGCGTFTFSLAEHLQVYAAEGAEDSLAALDAAARRSDRAGRVQAELRDLAPFPRQEGRCVGNEGVRTFNSWWSPFH